MTPRDPHDPQPRDRSLFQVLVGLIDASRANTDAVSRMGTQADEWASRCEAIERVCSDCQRVRDEYHKREEDARRNRGRVLTWLSGAWKSAPVQWFVGAVLVVGATLIARCAGVTLPALTPSPVPAPVVAPYSSEVSDVP